MLSFLFNILFHIFLISTTFALHQSQSVDYKSRRSLLPKNAYHFVTNITIEINSISTSDPYNSIIDTLYNQLNSYYTSIYNLSSNYNLSILSYTTSNTPNTINITLILYTKHVITRTDMDNTQQYIDDNISAHNPYTVSITHYTEHINRGNTNELEIEILIIVFVFIFIIIFIAIWFWRWRRRIQQGKAEVFFLDDYKAAKPIPKDSNTAQSDQTDITIKKEQEIEMVCEVKNDHDNIGKEVTGNEMYDDDEDDDEVEIDNDNDNDNDTESDPEIDDSNENMEVRDEDDEKAEELQLDETTNTGENIVIEDDD